MLFLLLVKSLDLVVLGVLVLVVHLYLALLAVHLVSLVHVMLVFKLIDLQPRQLDLDSLLGLRSLLRYNMAILLLPLLQQRFFLFTLLRLLTPPNR